jgi:hypothetical protein
MNVINLLLKIIPRERLIPGVTYIDQGARHDPIVYGKIDCGGAISLISP